MATLGLFSPELVAEAWFSPELTPVAWFDPTLVGAPTVVSFSDASVPVQVLVGTESASFVLVSDASAVVEAFVGAEIITSTFYDAGVPVQVFVGQESTVFVLFDDTSVPVDAFVGQETVDAAFDDAGVPVDAFVGVESATFVFFDDVSVPINTFVGPEALEFSLDDVGTAVNVFAGAETVEPSFEDADIAVEVFVGGETFESEFEDVGAVAEVFVGEEAFDTGFLDESVAVQAVAPSETASVGPTPPGPSPSPKPILAGGTPLEDYEVGGYTLRELREVRESLLEEIIELPVREESAEDKREREAGEPRFSEFLKRIIEEPVKPKAEKKPTNWLPAVAIGAFLLGAWLATSGESEAFAGEEPDDDLPDGPPEDESDLGDLNDPGDLEGDDLFFDEPLPLQGPEHAGSELPELVDSIEFRGEELPAGEEIPLENLSPEVADEELLRSIRQEAEEEAVKPKAPRKRRAAKARALTSEPETVLAYRPGRGRA